MYELKIKCPKCGAVQTKTEVDEGVPQECSGCHEVFLWDEYDVSLVSRQESAPRIPDLPGSDGEELLDLGACCACGKEDSTVRNAVMLHFRAPVPGTGWGCVVCNLPMDGAIAILCDDCIRQGKPDIKFAVKGFASDKQRIPFEELTEPFDHIEANHEAYEFLNAGQVEGVGQVIIDARPVTVDDKLVTTGEYEDRADLPYLEGFFKVKFLDSANCLISPISQKGYRRLEHKVAEVSVPYKTDTVVYGMIAMITNKRADEIALQEAVALQGIMVDIVKRFGYHFKPPQHMVQQ